MPIQSIQTNIRQIVSNILRFGGSSGNQIKTDNTNGFQLRNSTDSSYVGLIASTITAQNNILKIGNNSISFASAVPTTGTWVQGDVVFNINVSSGQPAGWQCLANGTPGSWTGISSIASMFAPPNTNQNLLINPGFESGSLDPWYSNDTVVSCSIVTDPHTGTYSLNCDASSGDSLIGQDVNVDVTKTYTLTGWIKILSAINPYVSAWLLDANNNHIGFSTNEKPANQWVQVSSVFNPTQPNIRINCYSQSGVNAVYDDIELIVSS